METRGSDRRGKAPRKRFSSTKALDCFQRAYYIDQTEFERISAYVEYYAQAAEDIKEAALALIVDHVNIAGIYYKQHRKSDALKHIERALDLHNEYLAHFNQRPSYLKVLSAFGNILLMPPSTPGEIQKAKEYITQALNIVKIIHPYLYHPDVVMCTYSVGTLYKAQGNIPMALKYYEESLELNKNIYTNAGQPMTLLIQRNIKSLKIMFSTESR